MHQQRKKEIGQYIRDLQEVTAMMRKWDSVNWKLWKIVRDDNSDAPLTDLHSTADPGNGCPEDDEECVSGSGLISGSGDDQLTPEEPVTAEADSAEPTEGSSRGGAQRHSAWMTAIITVLILASVYLL